MNRRVRKLFATALAVTIVFGAMQVIMPAHAVPSLPAFWVTPDQLWNPAPPGWNFTETVFAGIAAGQNAFEWQANITYDPTLLQVTGAEYTGGEHSAWWFSHGPTSQIPTIHNDVGQVDCGETLLTPDYVPGPSNGSILYINFTVIKTPFLGQTLQCNIDFSRPETHILDPALTIISPMNYSPARYKNSAHSQMPPNLEMVNMTENTFDWLHNWTSPPLPSPFTFVENITIDNLDSGLFLNNITLEWDYNCSLLSITDVVFDPLWGGHEVYNDVSHSPNGNLTLETDTPSQNPGGSGILVANVVCQIMTQGSVPPEPLLYHDDSPRMLTLVSAYSSVPSIGRISFWAQWGDIRPIEVYACLQKATYQHDVAVVAIASPKTVVGQGYVMNVDVNVTNQGDYAEDFNVTVYANATVIGTEEFASYPSANSTLAFIWNTTGSAYGNYAMSAYAEPVSGETDTANNNCTGGWVTVSVVGDITGPDGFPDGLVDMRDVGYVASRFLAEPGKPLWDPNADINGDGIIDMQDIGTAASHFLEHYP